jgi:hypothetical protein
MPLQILKFSYDKRFTIKNKLDIPFIQHFLKDIYWAAGRTMEEVQSTIDHSFVLDLSG